MLTILRAFSESSSLIRAKRITVKKFEVLTELPKGHTHTHEVTERCWENGSDKLLNSWLPQTFNLFKQQQEQQQAVSAKRFKRRQALLWEMLSRLAGYRPSRPRTHLYAQAEKGVKSFPLLPPA